MNMLPRQDSFQQLDPLYKIQPNNNNKPTFQELDDEDTKLDSKSETYEKPEKNSFADIFLKNENGNPQNETSTKITNNNNNSNNHNHYLSNSSIEANNSNQQQNGYYLDQTPSNQNQQIPNQTQQQQVQQQNQNTNIMNQYPEQQLQRKEQSFSQRFQSLPLQQQSSFNIGFAGYQPIKTESFNQTFNRQENPQENMAYQQDNFQLNQQQPTLDSNFLQKNNSINQQQKPFSNNLNQELNYQDTNLCLNKVDSIQPQQFDIPQLNFNSSFQQQQQQQLPPFQQEFNFYGQNDNQQQFHQIPRQSSLFAGTIQNPQQQQQLQSEKFQMPLQKIEYNDNNGIKIDMGNMYENEQQQQFPFQQNLQMQKIEENEPIKNKRSRRQKQSKGGKKKQTDQQKKVVQKVKKNLFRNFSRQFFDYLIDNWTNISNKLKKVLTTKQYTSFTHHLNQQQQKQIVTKQNFHKIFFPYKNKFVRQKAEENISDTQTNLNKKIMRAIAFQFIKSEFLQTCLTSRISNWPIFYEQRYNIISLLSSNASLY